MVVNVPGSQLHIVRFVDFLGVISCYYPGSTRQYFGKSHFDLEIVGLEDNNGDWELWRCIGVWHLSSGSDSWIWILTGKAFCENTRGVPMNFKGWRYRSCLCCSNGCSNCRLHIFHNLGPLEQCTVA